jgi:toxin YoeB
LEFEPSAFADLQYWVSTDERKGTQDSRSHRGRTRHPFSGIGKPEPLKHQAKGAWSRRIDQEHRLVYRAGPEALVIIARRFHY